MLDRLYVKFDELSNMHDLFKVALELKAAPAFYVCCRCDGLTRKNDDPPPLLPAAGRNHR